MRFTSVLILGVFGAAVALGCSSSNSSGGGGNGGSGGACTETENGNVVGCFTWTGLTTTQASSICPTTSSTGSVTYATVSSCPSANAVGTCDFKYTANGGSYEYSETFYGGATGFTCATVKQVCTSSTVQGSVATTFSGNGC